MGGCGWGLVGLSRAGVKRVRARRRGVGNPSETPTGFSDPVRPSDPDQRKLSGIWSLRCDRDETGEARAAGRAKHTPRPRPRAHQARARTGIRRDRQDPTTAGKAQHRRSKQGPPRRVAKVPGVRRVAGLCESGVPRMAQGSEKGRPPGYLAAGRPHSVRSPVEPRSPHQHAVAHADHVQFGSAEPKRAAQRRSRPASMRVGNCAK